MPWGYRYALQPSNAMASLCTFKLLFSIQAIKITPIVIYCFYWYCPEMQDMKNIPNINKIPFKKNSLVVSITALKCYLGSKFLLTAYFHLQDTDLYDFLVESN